MQILNIFRPQWLQSLQMKHPISVLLTTSIYKYFLSLILWSLASATGSKIKSSIFLTLESPAYGRCVQLLSFKMSTYTFSKVKPCDLCIVIVQVSLTSNCCLSCKGSYKSDSLVWEIIARIFRTKAGTSKCVIKLCHNSYW